MRKIILASTSPRRQELMKWTGLKFRIEPSNYEEDMTLKLPPRELAKFLARGKAMAAAARHKDAIVIGADTVVACAGRVLGKPRDAKDAKKMLQLLSGRKNMVYTGLTVIDTKTKKALSRVAKEAVYFRKISSREIDDYLESGEPFDKAAAYGIQGGGAFFIRKMDGDLWGAIGLPLYDLKQMLEALGVDTRFSARRNPALRGRAADRALFRAPRTRRG